MLTTSRTPCAPCVASNAACVRRKREGAGCKACDVAGTPCPYCATAGEVTEGSGGREGAEQGDAVASSAVEGLASTLDESRAGESTTEALRDEEPSTTVVEVTTARLPDALEGLPSTLVKSAVEGTPTPVVEPVLTNDEVGGGEGGSVVAVARTPKAVEVVSLPDVVEIPQAVDTVEGPGEANSR